MIGSYTHILRYPEKNISGRAFCQLGREVLLMFGSPEFFAKFGFIPAQMCDI
jgi:hypothetical protein